MSDKGFKKEDHMKTKLFVSLSAVALLGLSVTADGTLYTYGKDKDGNYPKGDCWEMPCKPHGRCLEDADGVGTCCPDPLPKEGEKCDECDNNYYFVRDLYLPLNSFNMRNLERIRTRCRDNNNHQELVKEILKAVREDKLTSKKMTSDFTQMKNKCQSQQQASCFKNKDKIKIDHQCVFLREILNNIL